MTHRERLLAACRGQPTDRLPWAPRLDLWYKARSYTGTLPAELAGLSLREIVESLGVPYHAVVPDFQELRSPEDEADRCLGIWRLRSSVHETQLTDVERVVSRDGDATRVTYHTPVGSVSGVFEHTEEMRRAGVTIPWVREHIFRGIADAGPLAFIFSNAEVQGNEQRFGEWQEWVGESGLAVGFANGAASPLHHMLHDLMSVETFFLSLHDYPKEMMALAEAIGEWLGKVLAAAASGPAEAVFWGGNYDAAITYPRFFEQHILPWLGRAADELHRNGKLLLTHTDGENSGLTRVYRESGMDIADSVCPAPMTRLSLEQAIGELHGITIWGGIPSVALLPELMPEAEFERLLDETLGLVKGRDRFILGIADTAPPEASWGRIVRITDRVSAL
ncbi:MAG: hypothetical protein ACE149_17205 [Armatimonadota bacterium]